MTDHDEKDLRKAEEYVRKRHKKGLYPLTYGAVNEMVLNEAFIDILSKTILTSRCETESVPNYGTIYHYAKKF